MNSRDEHIKFLILKYWKEALSASDLAELEDWKSQSSRHRAWLDNMLSEEYIQHSLHDLHSVEARTDLALKLAGRIADEEQLPVSPVRRISFFQHHFFRYAAAFILLLGAGAWFYLVRSHGSGTTGGGPLTVAHDAPPGGNKAILTLGNGSRIVLDSAETGTLSNQGNVGVIKLNAGQLAYRLTDKNAPLATEYNTVSTPRGGQFQLILADGSKVWLDAASSIRFPAAFTGSERKVEITGEAYFEVADNPGKPFHVKVNDLDVLVLGTHFNINAYDDEKSIRTTLLQGAVKVSREQTGYTIAPGEQVRMERSTHGITIKKDVNTEEVVAWKNGLFHFDKADVRTIMRQIARWYDLDVVFDGPVAAIPFSGKIPKNTNASIALKVLEEGGIHFKIEGKKVIVTP